MTKKKSTDKPKYRIWSKYYTQHSLSETVGIISICFVKSTLTMTLQN